MDIDAGIKDLADEFDHSMRYGTGTPQQCFDKLFDAYRAKCAEVEQYRVAIDEQIAKLEGLKDYALDSEGGGNMAWDVEVKIVLDRLRADVERLTARVAELEAEVERLREECDRWRKVTTRMEIQGM